MNPFGKLARWLIGFSILVLVSACAPSTPTPTAEPTDEIVAFPTEAPTPTFFPLMSPTAIRTSAPATSTRKPTQPTVVLTPAPVTHGTAARVTKVIDGDRIQVSMSGKTYTVRYIGIEAPELATGSQPAEWMAVEATAANRTLVDGKSVGLEKDVSEKNSAGELLRYVWTGEVMVNEDLLRRGMAQVRLYKPDTKYDVDFYKYQDEARNAQRGIWSNPPSGAGSTPVTSGGLTVGTLTTPVKRGAKAAVSVQAAAGTTCTIKVTYKTGSQPLDPTKAGSSGYCSWSWTVPTTAAVGTGKIVITAGGKTGTFSFLVQ